MLFVGKTGFETTYNILIFNTLQDFWQMTQAMSHR